MEFEFATAGRILFGRGRLRGLPGIAQGMGRRAALLAGADAARAAPVRQALEQAGAPPAAFAVSGEPTTERVAAIAGQARERGCDFVVAFGGGSVLDAGKAVAALLTNTRELADYLEVVGKGEPLAEDPAPCIAIPTTAGTGAEVTRNAVLLCPEHRVKVSMRHPKMLPAVALVDPDLTRSMPPAVTAGTGLDALVQLLEAFVSAKANPLTDGFCREGLRRAARSLRRAHADGDDMAARTDMALASLLGGLALANAGLGAVHGLAGPLGGMYAAPHGMVCAALLPAVFAANVKALRERAPDSPALGKYREAARLVSGSDRLEDGLAWIEDLCAGLAVPGLAGYGVDAAGIPAIAGKAVKASSMKGNPVQLDARELAGILSASLNPPARGNRTVR